MKTISIILSILTLLTSCAVKDNSAQTYTNIQDSVNLLSSEEFDGRRPGTDGNIKTQEYIENSLEKSTVRLNM